MCKSSTKCQLIQRSMLRDVDVMCDNIKYQYDSAKYYDRISSRSKFNLKSIK